MQIRIQHAVYGELVYEESFWTGKKTITQNGIAATKVDKKTFALASGEQMSLVGNIMTGVKGVINGEEIVFSPKSAWYEIVLAILPIVFIIVWGNIPAAVVIFPIVGGALGGLIGGIMGVTSIIVMKKTEKTGVKVLIGLGMFVAALLICWVLANILIGLATA